MLTVHAQIEEALLYPAARNALKPDGAHLVAEAHVEHASVKDLIEQIEGRRQIDEEYEAKVCVMGEAAEGWSPKALGRVRSALRHVDG